MPVRPRYTYFFVPELRVGTYECTTIRREVTKECTHMMNSYADRVVELSSQKPGELIEAVIKEESEVGTKKEFVAVLPDHISDIDPYSGNSDLNDEYNRRTAGKEFNRVEQIGLISQIPMFSMRNKKYVVVNPDIQNKLKKSARDPLSALSLTGIDESGTDTPSMQLTNRRDTLDNINVLSEAAAEAMMWYAGREIKRSDGDYPEYLGTRTLLFGHISLFVKNWKEKSPELSISNFGKQEEHEYKIDGAFECDPLRFRSDSEFIPPEFELREKEEDHIEWIVKDQIRKLLVSLLRYSSYNAETVTDRGVRNRTFRPGSGGFEFETLTLESAKEYKHISHKEYKTMSVEELRDRFETESKDWSTFNLAESLDLTVDVKEREIDFELEL